MVGELRLDAGTINVGNGRCEVRQDCCRSLSYVFVNFHGVPDRPQGATLRECQMVKIDVDVERSGFETKPENCGEGTTFGTFVKREGYSCGFQ